MINKCLLKILTVNICSFKFNKPIFVEAQTSGKAYRVVLLWTKGIVKVQITQGLWSEGILSAPLKLCHVVRSMGSRQCVVFGSGIFLYDFYTGWEKVLVLRISISCSKGTMALFAPSTYCLYEPSVFSWNPGCNT